VDVEENTVARIFPATRDSVPEDRRATIVFGVELTREISEAPLPT
jgi:hypothetical protein